MSTATRLLLFAASLVALALGLSTVGFVVADAFDPRVTMTVAHAVFDAVVGLGVMAAAFLGIAIAGSRT